MATNHSPGNSSQTSSSRGSIFCFSTTLNPITIRLDRNNYAFWRSQVIPAVHAHDLDGFLFGSRSCPPQFEILQVSDGVSPIQSPNPEFSAWIRHDQFLMHWLLSSISEAMLGHVTHCRSASEIWYVLERLFVTKSKARVLQV